MMLILVMMVLLVILVMINNCRGVNLADSKIEVVIKLGRNRNKMNLGMTGISCVNF